MRVLIYQSKANTYANSVDLDETTRNEPSLQGLHSLPFYLIFSIEIPD